MRKEELTFYRDLLGEIKARVRTCRRRNKSGILAGTKVNCELEGKCS